MALPYTFEDTLRVHDTAFINYVQGLRVDYDANYFNLTKNDVPILAAFATPDRAVASVLETLSLLAWITPAQALGYAQQNKDFTVLPLPFATIVASAPVPLEGRAMPWTVPTNPQGHPVIPAAPGSPPAVYPFYVSYSRDYTVSYWSRKTYTNNFIWEYIAGTMGNRGSSVDETMLSISHGALGVYGHSLKMSSFSDASEVEGDDPKYTRTDATFTLHVRMFKIPVA